MAQFPSDTIAYGVWSLNEIRNAVRGSNWPVVSAPPALTDEFFANVSLLLHGDGTSGAQNNTFLDSSANGFTITRNGNTTQGSYSPYGDRWSNYFDGTGDYLTVADNAAFAFGTGDFTIEVWVNFSNTGGDQQLISSYSLGFSIQYSSAWKIYLSGGTNVMTRSFTHNTGKWYHLALTRSGTDLRLFIDGVQQGVAVSNSTNIVSDELSIGKLGELSSQYFNGYLSDLRIVKGTALYTSAFTPPTEPLTAVTGTSLLTCQSNRFIDNSSNGFAITVNGDTKVTPFSPYAPSDAYVPEPPAYQSVLFDGTGDYLTVGSASNWNFLHNGSPWTIQFSANPEVTSAYTIMSTGISTVDFGVSFRINQFSIGELRLIVAKGTSGNYAVDIRVSNFVLVNQWANYAISFDGVDTYNFYRNGSLIDTSTVSTTYSTSNATDPLRIASWSDQGSVGDFFTGYLSDVRISDTVISGLTTNPTAPLEATADTVLLTCQDAFVDKSSNNFAITVNGNPTLDQFGPHARDEGYWSNEFDGTGDYLQVADDPALEIGSGDFTIEFWYWADAWVHATVVATKGWTSGVYGPWLIYRRTSGDQFAFFASSNGSSWDIAGGLTISSAVTLNKWNHFVICRQSGTLSTFANGVRQDTTTTSASFLNSTDPIMLMADDNGSSNASGYLSDFRIVVGSSVYDPTQTTITVPTAPLSAIAGTSLLTCQSNSFVDKSSNGFTITPNGDVSVAMKTPYEVAELSSGGSGYFDGTGDYLDFGSIDIATSQDFCAEAWVYLTAYDNAFTEVFAGPNVGTSGQDNTQFRVSSTGDIVFAIGAKVPVNVASAWPGLNQWVHVAWVRNSNVCDIYINGQSIGSGTESAAGRLRYIGEAFNGSTPQGYYINGYVSDARIVIGSPVYTSSFTPPTAPLPVVANTSFLCNFDNAGIFDSTGKNVIETVGNAQIDTTTVKYGTGAMKFDGTGDYLRADNQNIGNFGTSDFTVEVWVYWTGSGSQALIDSRASTGVTGWVLLTNNGILKYYDNGGYRIIDSVSFPTNQWVHVAVSRSSSGAKLFKDGVQVGSTYTNITNLTDDNLTIGANVLFGANLSGYLDDIRITKGVARYTANFTPPTEAFPDQ